MSTSHSYSIESISSKMPVTNNIRILVNKILNPFLIVPTTIPTATSNSYSIENISSKMQVDNKIRILANKILNPFLIVPTTIPTATSTTIPTTTLVTTNNKTN